jgi:hypothetical protein
MSAVVKRILLLSLALVLSLTLVGCGGEKLTEEEIDQIIANTITASADIDTVSFDMDMSMTVAVVGGSEAGEMTVEAAGTGVMDNANTAMQMVMNMTMDIPGIGEQEMAMEYYIVGEWMYMKIAYPEYPEMGEQWMKMELSDEIWQQQQSQIDQQIELLETAVTVDYLRSEMVDGTACYLFKIVPDMEALGDLLSQQAYSMAGMDFSQFNLADLFEEMSVKEWIAKDTYLVMKAEVYMTLEMSPEDVGATEEDFDTMTLDMSIGEKLYDYNQPVSIELPEEALNAQEVSY